MVSTLSLADQFKNALNKVQSSPFFIKQMKAYGLEGFQYEILTSKHIAAASQLVHSEMTKGSGNISRSIYNLLETETIAHGRYDHLIKYAAKTGLSFVVLDCENKIAAISLSADVVDKAPRADFSIYPEKYVKRGEFAAYCKDQHPFFKSLSDNINKYNLIKKGECIEYVFGILRRDLQRRRGCHVMFIPITWIIMYSLKSVKYLITYGSHPGSIRMISKLTRYFNTRSDEKKEIPFYTHLADSKPFFIEKFKNDQWYKNNMNETYIMNNIKKITGILMLICYDKLRKQYDTEQFLQHYMNAVTIKSKL